MHEVLGSIPAPHTKTTTKGIFFSGGGGLVTYSCSSLQTPFTWGESSWGPFVQVTPGHFVLVSTSLLTSGEEGQGRPGVEAGAGSSANASLSVGAGTRARGG